MMASFKSRAVAAESLNRVGVRPDRISASARLEATVDELLKNTFSDVDSVSAPSSGRRVATPLHRYR
jgi:hypothetical protein